MFDLMLRPLFDRVLIPFARAAGRHVHPNTITVSAFVIGLGSCWLVYDGRTMAGFVAWIVNRIVDGFDGVVARETGKQSDFGGYLDIMLDFVLYALLPIAFVIRLGYVLAAPDFYFLLWSLIALFAVFYVNTISWSYLSALLEKRNAATRERTSVTMPKGVIEGAETIVFYSLFFFFSRWMAYMMVAMAVLTLAGSIQRFLWARARLGSNRSGTGRVR